MAYATRDDLAKWGLRPALLAGIATTDQDAQLQAASELFDSYASQRGYTVPLTAWGDDLRASVCRVAAWALLNHRGANPENPADAGTAKAHDDAILWWRDVGRSVANLNTAVTTPPRIRSAVPQVISDYFENGEKTRGW